VAEQTIKQKADAEAARAEAEEPDAEPTEPVEPTPEQAEEDEANEEGELEPAEPEAKGGRKTKSPQERFEAAFAAFRKKAAEVFEVPVAEVHAAPHPGVVGIMLPGFAEPKTHPDFKGCDTCNTLGKILTGANTGDPANDWHTCPDKRCAGRGYWTKQAEVPQPVTTGPLAVQAPSAENGEWGEAPAWMGDPSLTPQS
jgi:hypothetical protein